MQEYQQGHTSAHVSSLLTAIARTSIVLVLGLLFLGAILGVNVRKAQASDVCSASGHPYVMVKGDTLSRIANRYGADRSQLASYNRSAHPHLLHVNQRICMAGTGVESGSGLSPVPITKPVTSLSAQLSWTSTSTTAAVEASNQFAYPQCTWWANKRYHQLHGVYVPWRTNANAWQWTARAYGFGWHVSWSPSVGSLIDLQPWVQGAYGQGHVGVVEQVLPNRDVIASSTNWGSNPYAVSYTEFAPGRGVTFIRQ